MAPQPKHFQIAAFISIILVYFLIFVGGTVRATGSGLGCPDWPKCFGKWIPPTHAAELPPEYAATDFNAAKTWTEYLNRLIGVLIGFSILITALLSAAYRKKDPRIWIGSWVISFLVGLQGWLGAKVVSSLLHPYMISLHMALALIIILGLIWVYIRAKLPSSPVPSFPTKLRALGYLTWLIMVYQIILGIQVRQKVDGLSATAIANLPLLELIGTPLAIHRSFAWIVLICTALWIYALRKTPAIPKEIRTLSTLLGVTIASLSVLGMIMLYLHLPTWTQPLHLLFACELLGVQSAMLLILNGRKARRRVSPASRGS